MLNLIIILLALICIAAYIIIGKMLASEKKYKTDLDEAEKASPLAAFFNPDLRLDEEAMSSLRPTGSAQAIAWDERLRLTGPDSPQGNGFHIFADKSGYARVQVPLPAVSQDMLDWWYAWVGFEPIRHKIWFPGRHVQALYGAEPEDGICSLRNFYGRTLYSIERIGRNAPLQKLEYLMVRPDDWGLGAATDNGSYFVCQAIKNGPFQLGRVILHFEARQDGCAATAHIWLGGELLKILRPYLAGGQSLYDWSYHTCQELEQLAALLPRLYADYHP